MFPRVRASATSLQHLAQGREIVLHDILKPVRVKHVVDVGEHASDVIVPILHALVEAKVFWRQVVESGFALQVSCLPVLGMFDALLRSADAGVLQYAGQRGEVAAEPWAVREVEQLERGEAGQRGEVAAELPAP